MAKTALKTAFYLIALLTLLGCTEKHAVRTKTPTNHAKVKTPGDLVKIQKLLDIKKGHTYRTPHIVDSFNGLIALQVSLSTVKLLQAKSLKAAGKIETKGTVEGLAFLESQGCLVLVVSDDKGARLDYWCPKSLVLEKSKPVCTKRIIRLAFSDKGNMLAFTQESSLGTVGVYDTVGGKKVRDIAISDSVHEMALSPHGNYLATGYMHFKHRPEEIHIWEVDSGKLSATSIGGKGSTTGLCFADAFTLASASRDGLIRLIYTPNGNELDIVPAFSLGFPGLVADEQHGLIAHIRYLKHAAILGGYPRRDKKREFTIEIWRYFCLEHLGTIPLGNSYPHTLAFCSEAPLLIAVDEEIATIWKITLSENQNADSRLKK